MINLSPNNYQDPKGWDKECDWCGSPDHRSEDCEENPANKMARELGEMSEAEFAKNAERFEKILEQGKQPTEEEHETPSC